MTDRVAIRAKPGRKDLPPGCAVWGGILFCAAGLAGLAWHVGPVRDLLRARRWQPVPASIEGVWLPTKSDDEGGISRRVTARYSYEYGGRAYLGERVSPEMFASSWRGHLERYRELAEHQRQKKPFTAWVNPEDPSQSMLYRSVSPFFWIAPGVSVAAVLLGLLAVAGGRALGRAQRWRRESLRRNPKRPWRADLRWAKGFRFGLKYQNNVAGSWGCALFATVVFGPWIVICTLTPASLWVRLLAGAAALIPVLALCAAVRSTLARLLYRPPRLDLSEMPIVPGRRSVCTVRCGKELRDERAFNVHIRCQRTVAQGDRRVNDCPYEHRREVSPDIRQHDPATCVSVEVLLPEDAPPISPDIEGQAVDWSLMVTAASSVLRFSARFDLPVFRVDDESLIEKRPPGADQP